MQIRTVSPAKFDCCCHYYFLSGAWGLDDYETSRRIRFGNTDRVATADYDGQQVSVYLERGRDVYFNARQVFHIGSGGAQFVW